MSLTPTQEALVGAAASGDLATVEELLKDGVDPNGTTTDGKTALDVASTQQIRHVLTKHGGKPGLGTPNGYFRRMLRRLFG